METRCAGFLNGPRKERTGLATESAFMFKKLLCLVFGHARPLGVPCREADSVPTLARSEWTCPRCGARSSALAIRSDSKKRGPSDVRFATDTEIMEAEAEFATLKQTNPMAHKLLSNPCLRQRKTIDS